jgi:glycosyltransferase involved in cell wall biosynthesis
MRVAIVHYWFLNYGGGERVAELLGDMFPQADVFTIFADPKGLPANLKDRTTVSFLDKIPRAHDYSRFFFPFYPMAIEAWDLSSYDLIISSDTLGVKGVVTRPGQLHICYCHTPSRYVFDDYERFKSTLPWAVRPGFAIAADYFRRWDYKTAQKVDEFIANSKYVADRITTYYHRESTLIYPPVNTQRGYIDPNPGDYYLYLGRFVENKRIDILIEACNRLGRRMVIGGTGRVEKQLKAIAGPTIEFLGRVPDADLAGLYAKARAFLFASDEDFGIVPLEAQSFGRPVIAWGHGGSLETVIPYGSSPKPTGIHYEKQTPESAAEGILKFESVEHVFDPVAIRAHANRFDTSIFIENMRNFIQQKYEEHTGVARPVPIAVPV